MSVLTNLVILLATSSLVGVGAGTPIAPQTSSTHASSTGIQWSTPGNRVTQLHPRTTSHNSTMPKVYKSDNITAEWCSVSGPAPHMHDVQRVCDLPTMTRLLQIGRVTTREPGFKSCNCREWGFGKAVFRLCNCDTCDALQEEKMQEMCKRLTSECIEYEESAGYLLPANRERSWYAMLYTNGTKKEERAVHDTFEYQFLKKGVNNTCKSGNEGRENQIFSGYPECNRPGWRKMLWNQLFSGKCWSWDAIPEIKKIEL